ncbi:MAG: SufD family Fe-S cluster assembly protein [Bacteroidia bacterium]|nr:SufD family Fe-S cluster assembly protein [Bacteroidia bacterium]MDW8134806.1 SufD family Fe-S cluster assembly protein [Bacteroidia bacterium]
MEMLKSPALTLEEGAAHLTRLLQEQVALANLPPNLRVQWDKWVQEANLQTLFWEQRHKEDWKYTPMDFLRFPWDVGLARRVSPPFSIPSVLPYAEEVDGVEKDLPALRSLPVPSSPWEALLGGTSSAHHYYIRKEGSLIFSVRGEGGVVPYLLTLSLAPHSVGEVWLFPSTEALMLLRFHLHVGQGACLKLFFPSYANEAQGYLYTILSAHLEREASLETYDLSTSREWRRTEVKVYLKEAGAKVYLHGAAYVDSKTTWDQAIRVEHGAPHTESNQLFKSLVRAGGRSIFQGRIYVHRDAQKTNAYQSHKALLWEKNATAYSRPQLEIFADDVRCTHGVTTGFLQGEMLTYLRTRGIPLEDARKILASAFLAEVIEKVPYEILHTEMYKVISSCLSSPAELSR